MDQEDLKRMSHVMRHRMRNIAAGLRGSLGFIEEEVTDQLSSGLAEYFPLIYRECDDLQVLANRVSLFFDDLPALMPCSAEDAVNKVLEDVAGRFPSVSFQVQGACSDSVDGLMEAALNELLVNACEAAPSGVVEVRVERQASRVLWTVLDNGSGMDSTAGEADPFAPFLTTRSRHIGLGLPIVRRLCEKAGGECILSRLADEEPFSTGIEMSATPR